MSWQLPPWRSEVEESRKAEQVARNIREASRQADLYRPGGPPVDEDENGFVELASYRIPGMVWIAEGRDTDGERLSWLHGEAS
jgi:hypothetical protein